MRKESTIIKVDIDGYNAVAQSNAPEDTADYLLQYYDAVFALCKENGWEIIKTMGDCVLITAPDNAIPETVNSFCNKLGSAYSVNVHYRKCSFEEIDVAYSNFACRDVFGKDINNLFMEDSLTQLAS